MWGVPEYCKQTRCDSLIVSLDEQREQRQLRRISIEKQFFHQLGEGLQVFYRKIVIQPYTLSIWKRKLIHLKWSSNWYEHKKEVVVGRMVMRMLPLPPLKGNISDVPE